MADVQALLARGRHQHARHHALACRIPAPGSIKNAPLHLIDLMPTIVGRPARNIRERIGTREILPMAGTSLMPALRGDTCPKDALFRARRHRAVREGRYKLTALRGESWKLYDMERDRTEMADLADSSRGGSNPWRRNGMRGRPKIRSRRCPRVTPSTTFAALRPIEVARELFPYPARAIGGRRRQHAALLQASRCASACSGSVNTSCWKSEAQTARWSAGRSRIVSKACSSAPCGAAEVRRVVPPVVHEHVEGRQRFDVMPPAEGNEQRVPGSEFGLPRMAQRFGVTRKSRVIGDS